jgi:hypothetical protein
MISSIDIKKNGIKWASADNFTKILKDREAVIINTDISIGQGIHWIVLYPYENICLIVDSLGKNNNRNNNSLILQTIKENNLKPYIYDGEFQYKDNTLCGWYAIYISNLINQHKADIRTTIKMINQIFGRTADDDDIKVLIDAFTLSQ